MPTKLKTAFVLLCISIMFNALTGDFVEAGIEMSILVLLNQGAQVRELVFRALTTLGDLISMSYGLLALATIVLLLNNPTLADSSVNMGHLTLSVAGCIYGIVVSVFCYLTLTDATVRDWFQAKKSEAAS